MSTATETPRSILLSTDFRSESDGSLDAVAKLALAFESNLSVLHVIQNVPLAIQQSYQGKDDTLLMQPALRSLAEKHVPVAQSSWLAAAAETGEFVDAKLEHAEEWVQEFDRSLAGIEFSGIGWKRDDRVGSPNEQIVAAAKEHGADLIMMGATGRTGLVRVLLGSTTRRLLRSLPCSLLSIKQDNVLEELFESDVEAPAVSKRVSANPNECSAGQS